MEDEQNKLFSNKQFEVKGCKPLANVPKGRTSHENRYLITKKGKHHDGAIPLGVIIMKKRAK